VAQLAQQQLQAFADDFRRTYAESRRRLQQMTTLYEVSSLIGATVNPREVVERTVEGLKRLVPGEATALYLLEEGRLTLEELSLPEGQSPERHSRVALSGDLLGQCLARGQVVLSDEVASLSQHHQQSSAMAVPLSTGSQQLGAVLLVRERARPHQEEDRRLAEMVAFQAAMALQNARLATTDGLTGLYNRRYFEQVLQFECERAARVGRPLGLLMIDIDHFKRYNERFGHPAGDEVLRLVATTLAEQLRRTDIVARFGGEEFAAILPEDDQAAVAVAAERLRQAVELRAAVRFEGRELPGVRVSIGGTSLSGRSAAPRTLIRAADAALRKAKRAGRNRCLVQRPALSAGATQASSGHADPGHLRRELAATESAT
jgi:diguanylate cyclase (GGDEF)-like protein